MPLTLRPALLHRLRQLPVQKPLPHPRPHRLGYHRALIVGADVH